MAQSQPDTGGNKASASLRTACVDMQELFKEYPRTVEVQKKFEEYRARIEKEGKERGEAIEKLRASVEALHKQLEDPAVNETKKQTLFKEFQTQQQQGVALERERREYLMRRSRALNEHMMLQIKELLEEIRKYVMDYAAQSHYDHVFDSSGSSASQIPLLLYTKDSTDITAEVLKTLKKPADGGSADK